MQEYQRVCYECDDVARASKIISEHPELITINGSNMIFTAICFERVGIMMMLINVYPNLINARNEFGVSLLKYAVSNNRCQCVRKILDCAPELLREIDNAHHTIFHTVVRNTDSTLLTMFMECDQKNGPLYVIDVPCTQYQINVVHEAAMYGNLAFLSVVNSQSLSMMTTDKYTTLHYAVQNGRIDCVRYLLKKCPQLCKVENAQGKTPLHIAIYQRSTVLIKLLIDCDITVMTSCKISPLSFAILSSTHDIVSFLLRLVPRAIDEVNKKGETQLHLAAMFDNRMLINILLHAKPILLHQIDKRGRTALHVASKSRNFKTIKEMFTHCHDLRVIDCRGNTSLHLIVNTTASKELIAKVYNANPNNLCVQNYTKITPFHIVLSKPFPNNMVREFFESVLTLGDIIDTYNKCQKSYHVVQSKVVRQCDDIISLLPPLRNIIYEYLGFDIAFKKRKTFT